MMLASVAPSIHQLPDLPRKIDAAQTFESIVAWIHDKSIAEKAPGLIIGISGTDSILTYLACAKAFERLGKPHRVLGVHYGPPLSGKNSAASNWVTEEIFPWLRHQAQGALLELDSLEDYQNDHTRWGRLFSRAVADTGTKDSLSSNHYFTVGTRNATEEYLGAYSQISGAVSMLPIVDLLKSEVLDICAHLGVPQIAIAKSCEIDCNCGRYQVAADYLREVDLLIMHRKGWLSRGYIENNMPPDVQAMVLEYVLEEESRNRFRKRTPYKPASSLAVTAE